VKSFTNFTSKSYKLAYLKSSAASCSHFRPILGNAKKVIFNNTTNTQAYFWKTMHQLALRARDTVKFMRRVTPQFISLDVSWSKSGRLPHLGHDAGAWCVSSTNPRYTGELRQWIIEIWAEFQQSLMDDATDQWLNDSLWRCLPDIQVVTRHDRFFS